MIEQTKVYRIRDLDSLVSFLREDLLWDLPKASIDDVSFEWTGDDLNLSESIHKKLKDGIVRQLQPFSSRQPWGIFVIEFAVDYVSIITLRQILRCFVAKRRGARPDLPAWQCDNLLFICLYGENGFTFAHFKGDRPYSSKLTTFSWHPGEPIRTVCEFNLPALRYDDTWMPEAWVTEWQKAFDVEKVNKQFYRQISQFYYRLTGKEGHGRELVLPYVGDGPRSSSIYEEFAVRLIGRSIFCWFLKHKISEEAKMPLIPREALSLAAARETEDFYHSILEPLFFEVMNKPFEDRKPLAIPRSEIVPFLNGGLFEPHHNDFYVGEPNRGLKIPDAWFIDFFSLLERYNFTITENSSIDVDVAVDPEMLGRIFENLLAEVVPETGETARKATGSYYTPRAIVDYMVEQSLKQYLLTRTELGEERVNRLLDYGESVVDFLPEEKLAAVTALREVKVIDPACGSGAFPMGVLHRMLAVLEKVDPRLELWQAQYLESLDGIVRQAVEKSISRGNWVYIRKLMIIRDSIYGVDIQPIATEIAKLRCFLSLVVDEIVLDSEDNRGVEPLPNLEFKFVAADSLIGLPPTASQSAFGVTATVSRLKELREAYLRSFGARKVQIEREFRATQRKLFEENVQWAVADTLVKQLTDWDPFSYESCSWFDPAWMFGEDRFDIVIANPPYLGESGHKQVFRHIKQGTLRGFYQGKMDIFYFFFHLAINIGADDGQIAFITTDYYPTATGAKRLRADFRNRTSIRQLVDFNELKIFESAQGQHNMITILSKKPDDSLMAFTCVTERDGLASPQVLERILSWRDEVTRYYQIAQSDLFEGEEFYIRLAGVNSRIGSDNVQTILNKVKTLGQQLDAICTINQGVVSGCDYVSSRNIDKMTLVGDVEYGDGIFVFDLQNERDRKAISRFSDAERALLRPFFKNTDIQRYWCKAEPSKYLLYYEGGLKSQEYPNIHIHLGRFKEILEKRLETYEEDYHWTALHRPRNSGIFVGPKILAPYRSRTNSFAYSESEWFCRSDSYVITQKDSAVALKYVLALLNSRLFYVWLYHKGKRKGETLELFQRPLSEIPIKKISKNEQQSLISIVDNILSITRHDDYPNSLERHAKVEELEHQVDHIVYQLYDLTPEEIAVVGQTSRGSHLSLEGV